MWKKFGDMGLLGVTVPEELGGLGKGYLDHLIVMEEVSHKALSLTLSEALDVERERDRFRKLRDPSHCRTEPSQFFFFVPLSLFRTFPPFLSVSF